MQIFLLERGYFFQMQFCNSASAVNEIRFTSIAVKAVAEISKANFSKLGIRNTDTINIQGGKTFLPLRGECTLKARERHIKNICSERHLFSGPVCADLPRATTGKPQTFVAVSLTAVSLQ